MCALRRLVAVALAAAFLVPGCGRARMPSPQSVTPVEPSAQSLLDAVAETGELGSNLPQIESALERVRADDPAKGEQLMKDFAELRRMTGNPEMAKVKARQMANRL